MAYVSNKQIMQNVLSDTTYACAHWIQEIQTSIKYKDLQGECVEDKWFNCLERGGNLIIIDNEDYEKHIINYSSLSKAISQVRQLPQFKFITSHDETFADLIMQIAVFDELVFD